MRQTLRWLLAVSLYFGIVVYFLRAAIPGSECFYCGPSPGLWWGELLTPGPLEYYRHKAYYDFLYLVPYLGAGLFFTAWGVGVARVRWAQSRVWRAITAGLVTLLVTLLAAVASDAGVLLGAWQSGLLLLHGHYSPYLLIMVLPRVFFPAAALSGFVALARAKGLL